MPNFTFDPDDFLICEHDLEGRRVQIAFRVPPILFQTLNEIMGSCKFPFETIDDVIRWCVCQGINALAKMEPSVSNVPALNMSLLLTRTDLHLKAFADFFKKLDIVMIQLSSHSYLYERSRKSIKAIEELILCMPSSKDRSLYHGEIKRRWGHLLREPETQALAEATDVDQAGEMGPRDDPR